MSGHFATLLRGTVESMLPEHDVYVTDWTDARDVCLSEGRFDLADYTDYIRDFARFLAADGERVSIMAVCPFKTSSVGCISIFKYPLDTSISTSARNSWPGIPSFLT